MAEIVEKKKEKPDLYITPDPYKEVHFNDPGPERMYLEVGVEKLCEEIKNFVLDYIREGKMVIVKGGYMPDVRQIFTKSIKVTTQLEDLPTIRIGIGMNLEDDSIETLRGLKDDNLQEGGPK